MVRKRGGQSSASISNLTQESAPYPCPEPGIPTQTFIFKDIGLESWDASQGRHAGAADFINFI